MLKRLIFIAAMTVMSVPLSAKTANHSFLTNQEEDTIESGMVGDLPVLVLEDFQTQSVSPAIILAIENNLVLVKRNDLLALLVPKADFESVLNASPFVMFPNTCQTDCAASGVGGAITGLVAGAGAGAGVGALIAGPVGAAGGLVLGGGLGLIGGTLTGFEACKWASGCSKKNDVPEPDGSEPP